MINREREVLERLLNLVLRGTTLVSKFALLFVLAKFLEPLEVGLYGLFSATIFVPPAKSHFCKNKTLMY